MRSWRATHNEIAVSANARETAMNTEQSLDTLMLVDLNDVINLEPRRKTNEDELKGLEEPDAIYDLGALSGGSFNFNRAQAQHFAFLISYALGTVSSAAAGTGYEHTITPISDDHDENRSIPSFTAAMRYGKTVLKRRYASMFVDAFTCTFSVDDWCRIGAEIKGSGKISDNIEEESVTAADTVTELTLSANAVEGSTAQERLDNVQRIRAETSSGIWEDVTYTAVSSATPAVITIAAPGSSGGDITYKVLYIPTESGWMSFPERITETPLRVSEMQFIYGGTWNGSQFTGGRTICSEIRSVEWNFSNNLEIEFTPCAGGAYASRAFRPARSQTIRLNREFRNTILQQQIDDNESTGFYIIAQGDVYDSPHRYQVEIIFPSVGILKSPISVDGKRLAEAGDLIPLENSTYGSVIVKVKNLQSAYAA